LHLLIVVNTFYSRYPLLWMGSRMLFAGGATLPPGERSVLFPVRFAFYPFPAPPAGGDLLT